uniref:Uncharacterized protein n=1 Tax=Raoultella planticola TaxID=575 RepID=W8CUF8_RAOPL|nr:hypothetical protein pKpNDM1_00157 [Raoultella planticola]QZX60341.1 hypothetical protein [Klebsiella michiganensis]UGK55233.1 Hypothetical protein [Raoultella ornithinolytica]UMW96327.1 hypothetical protein [Raoultella ornithinolytica]UWX38346.1 hypothetical protein KK467_p0190 [Klebsiella pneumoniae]
MTLFLLRSYGVVYLGVIVVFSGLIRINGFSGNPHINQPPPLLFKWGCIRN